MDANGQIIRRFYEAFSRKDFTTMQQCYHRDAIFHDPVFGKLNATEVKAMWEMLLRSSNDLEITFTDIRSGDNTGHCHWEATYSFSLTGRRVHNIIEAAFLFRDGKIVDHRDEFNLYRWTRQAFGFSGIVLGWTSFMQTKIRARARHRLEQYLARTVGSI